MQYTAHNIKYACIFKYVKRMTYITSTNSPLVFSRLNTFFAYFSAEGRIKSVKGNRTNTTGTKATKTVHVFTESISQWLQSDFTQGSLARMLWSRFLAEALAYALVAVIQYA